VAALRPELPAQVFSADGIRLAELQPPDYHLALASAKIPPLVFAALYAAEVPINVTDTLQANLLFAVRLMRQQYDERSEQRTLYRKAKEWISAAGLVYRIQRDSLETLYMNEQRIWAGQRGMAAAGHAMFGKPVAALNVHEIALIVGMMKAPTQYHPLKYPEAARARRNEVIQRMADLGTIPQGVANKQQAAQLGLRPKQTAPEENDGVAYFTRHVSRWVESWAASYADSTGKNLDFRRDGLRIYTTLDSRLQAHAQAAAHEHLYLLQPIFSKQQKGNEPWRKDTAYLPRRLRATPAYQTLKSAGKTEDEIFTLFARPKRMRVLRAGLNISLSGWRFQPVWQDTVLSTVDSLKHYLHLMQPALISADTRTGAVRAWVGGLAATPAPLDHVAQTRRQVGSAFKPFVYGAALQKGMRVCDSLPNRTIAIKTLEGDWKPRNAEGQVGQMVSLRCALAFSVNIVTARVIDSVGAEAIAAYAHKAGITTPLRAVPSLGLGTTELSLYEMTEAFRTLANLGTRQPMHVVSRIEDAKGRVLYVHKQQPLPELDSIQTYTLLDMMRDVTTYGTAGTLKQEYGLYGIDIAGKTGTTQGHSDGWFMSVTPELTTGVWVGCDDPSMRFPRMDYGRASVTALPLGGRYLKKAYQDKQLKLERGRFTPPRGTPKNLGCGSCPPGLITMQDTVGLSQLTEELEIEEELE